MLTMTLITIAIASWAIVLEVEIKRKERLMDAVSEAIRRVAEGRARIVMRDEKIVFEPTTNKGGL